MRIKLLETPYEYEGVKHVIRFSGGIALYNVDGHDWDSVFTAADRRAYQS
jgi:GGDEF domain-containing protein